MKWMLATLFFLFALPARAAPECLYRGALCVGDSAYIERSDGPIVYQLIGYVDPEDQTVNSQPASQVATVGYQRCAQLVGSKLCPGDRGKVANESGVVLGIFNDQTVLWIGEAGGPQKVASSAVRVARYEDLSLPPDATGHDAKNCAEPSGPILADDSPAKQYFAALLQKGMSASLDEFLHLWYPGPGVKGAESPLFGCEEKPGGKFRAGLSDAELSGSCRPESLYSWGPYPKVQAMKKLLADGNLWQGPAAGGGFGAGKLYATASPAATFGYGPVLIRIKPAAHAVLLDAGGSGPQAGKIRYRREWVHDFLVEDAAAVGSWSYGTPEIYDEVVRDILRFKSGRRVSLYQEHALEQGAQGLGRLYLQAVDGHRFDDEVLKGNLLELVREILLGEGRIYYAKGECRNRRRHYAAERPTYFNPIPVPK